jgi:hypothetical protein
MEFFMKKYIGTLSAVLVATACGNSSDGDSPLRSMTDASTARAASFFDGNLADGATSDTTAPDGSSLQLGSILAQGYRNIEDGSAPSNESLVFTVRNSLPATTSLDAEGNEIAHSIDMQVCGVPFDTDFSSILNVNTVYSFGVSAAGKVLDVYLKSKCDAPLTGIESDEEKSLTLSPRQVRRMSRAGTGKFVLWIKHSNQKVSSFYPCNLYPTEFETGPDAPDGYYLDVSQSGWLTYVCTLQPRFSTEG